MWPLFEVQKMTYSDRIQHPDALNPAQERRAVRLSWILLGIAVVVVLAWRAGWLGKIAGSIAFASIANPNEWV